MLQRMPSSDPVAVFPAGSPTASALADLAEGLRAWHLWGRLAWYQVRGQYRQSVIGPLWLTLSMAVLVGSLGFLYTYLFHRDPAEYLPYLAGGFVLWGLIARMVNDGCSVFIGGSQFIKQIRLPLSLLVYRMVLKNFIILAHHFVVLVAVMVLVRLWPGWVGLLVLPGLALFVLNGLWVALLLGTISARFRDVPPVIGSLLQLSFFLTPILWHPDMRPGLTYVVNLNPFYHFIHIVRAPLLGELPGLHNYLAAGAITLAGWTLALLVYRRYRNRIAYWV